MPANIAIFFDNHAIIALACARSCPAQHNCEGGVTKFVTNRLKPLCHGHPTGGGMLSLSAECAGQTACKPGSVPAREGDGWPFLWDAHCWTPRATDPGDVAETPLPVARRVTPIWSCSRWGLPCRFRYRSRGGLLPHRFTLACLVCRPKTGPTGGLFSVALSLGSPPPAVSRHRVSVEPGLSSPLAECSHPAV